MVIAVLDDEPLQLSLLMRSIREACPEAELMSYATSSSMIADFQKGIKPDVAFVDVEMPGMSGIELARNIKQSSNATNIVFVTAHPIYAVEAAELHASGYIVKPITTDRVKSELCDLRYLVANVKQNIMVVHTFGNFETFINTLPVNFKSAKAKELFALLVDRRGAGLSTAEIAAVLWEDREYTISLKNQVQKTISQLRTVLIEYNCGDVLVKGYNSTALDTTKIICDYYDFINNRMDAEAEYIGEYMTQYSWAEDTAAFLYSRIEKIY